MENSSRFRRILMICILCAAGFLTGLFLLPIALPFLLGLALAGLVEKPVRRFTEGGSLPRWLSSGLCVGILLLVIGTAFFFLCKRLLFELGAFAAQLPEALSALSDPIERLQQLLQRLAARAPDGFGQALQEWLNNLFAGSSGLSSRLTAWLFSFAANLVSALPDLLLFLLTALLSSFMFSAQFPELRRLASHYLPLRWRSKVQDFLSGLRTALGGWIRAQLMLMLITFVLVTAGLFLMHLDFALLFGALIALIDALPLLGAGTVLIPWGVLMFLRGSTRCGIGLLLLYGVTALTRGILEPRLIGKQIGLHPILTLVAMYAGYRIIGVLGMIVFPIAAILIQQILELTLPRRSA